MADKFLRMIAMLEQIPKAPYKRTPAEIHDRLVETGYKTDVRSVQRDLEYLSGRLSIVKPTGATNPTAGTGRPRRAL